MKVELYVSARGGGTMISQRIRYYLEKIMVQERCSKKFAMTVCLGAYIGISPLIGFHTILTFVFAWMFALNLGTLFAVSFLIHNPWTTLPIYMFDHFFGKWLFCLCGVDAAWFDPAWMEGCNAFLMHHTGISGLSLSAFLVGGNVLALAVSMASYPLSKKLFEAYAARKIGQSSALVMSE